MKTSKPRFSTLPSWLEWQMSLHRSEIDLGLERIAQVAKKLDLQNSGAARVITVAGTNGKGSCVTSLEKILLFKNKTVGTLTSPHVVSYNERICINAKAATDESICEAFDVIDKARGVISLTYFEFNTLAALYLFKQAKLDYWLLEVGLGGRLDATNIIDTDIAIITSIALDHVEWLGDNRESIAAEKVGICRYQKPFVCADLDPPQTLAQSCQALNCPRYWLGEQFGIEESEQGFCVNLLNSHGDANHVFEFKKQDLRLPIQSVAAALQACLLENITLNQSDIDTLTPRLKLLGRMQLIEQNGVSFIFDIAHNPAASRFVVKRFRELYPDKKKVYAVFAVMSDKDIVGMVEPLSLLVSRWYLPSMSDFARAADNENVYNAIKIVSPGATIELTDDVSSALQKASDEALCDASALLVTGSFAIVGEALVKLNQQIPIIEAGNPVNG